MRACSNVRVSRKSKKKEKKKVKKEKKNQKGKSEDHRSTANIRAFLSFF